jgi:hypothetical protein
MKAFLKCVVLSACATWIVGMALADDKKADAPNAALPASPACANPDAATPEVYSLFGEGKKVFDKIGNLNVDLPKRKIYVLILEGPESAQVFLYEKAGDKKVNLSHWSGKSASDLRADIEKGIMSNRGVNCVGEQTKEIIKKLGEKDIKTEKDSDAPATVKAAVSHAVQDQGDKFIRVTVFLLC